MNVQINKLVKSLLQKDSIEQCSIQELQQYADRHPYFGAAQLLLAKKMKAEKAAAAKAARAEKAAAAKATRAEKMAAKKAKATEKPVAKKG